ncbi:MAG: hypothetical protein AB7Q97_17125 [Gammaproteobacteria bacterium]
MRYQPGLIAAIVLVLSFAGSASIAAAPAVEVRIGYVGAVDAPARLGVGQGLSEANMQGRFLGQKYMVENLGADAKPTPGIAALAVAGDPALVRSLAASWAGHPVFNLTADDDALRAACLPNVLHVPPSARMRADAEAQWRQAHPDRPAQAHAWHATAEKYAASQLNGRFNKQFGRPMDDAAWAGWAAVKMLSDSVARLSAADPAALLAFLRGELAFDGQKGVEMTFRADGQLRQMLLLVREEEIVGEAPVRGVAPPEALDSLGATPACR